MNQTELSIDTSLLSEEPKLMLKDPVNTPDTKSSPFKGEERCLTFKKLSDDLSVEKLNSNIFDDSPILSFGRRFQCLSKEKKHAKKLSFDPRIISGILKIKPKQGLKIRK